MLGQVLLKQGLLTASQLAQLLKAPEAQAPRPFGKYTLGRPLGQGGMGEVFAAIDRTLDRPVAIKLLSLPDARSRQRFAREAKLAARLEHPAIVPVYEVGEMNGRPFIAMQLIDGQDLRACTLPLRAALAALRAVAEAVEYAHAQGVVHRDIKPGNILMSGERVLLTDFGLARDLTEDDAAPLSVSGAILGTPAYMAPEQAHGKRREIGPRTDVYALGATLYYLVTGKDPFRGKTRLALLSQVIGAELVPPRRLEPRLPAAVQTIILKAMEASPADRYQSARALGDDIGRFLAGQPIAAVPPSLPVRLRRQLSRHRAWVAGVAAVLTVAAVATGFALRQRARHHAEQARLRGDDEADRTRLEAQRAAELARLERDARQARDAARQTIALVARRLDQARAELHGFDLQVYAPHGSQKINTAYLQRAERIAAELERLAPEAGAGPYVRGAVLRRRERLDAAFRALETATERSPGDVHIHRALVDAHADRYRELLAKTRMYVAGTAGRARSERRARAESARLRARLERVRALGGETGFASDEVDLRAAYQTDPRATLQRIEQLASKAKDYRRRSSYLALRARLVSSVRTRAMGEVEAAYRRAIALRPSDWQLMAELARQLLRRARVVTPNTRPWLLAADRLADQIIAIHPTYARAHVLKGEAVQVLAGRDVARIKASIGHYDEALRLDPELGGAYVARAGAHQIIAIRSPREAEAHLGRAVADYGHVVRMIPRSAPSARMRIAILLDLRAELLVKWADTRDGPPAIERLERARKDVDAALELTPSHRYHERAATIDGKLAAQLERAGRDPIPRLKRAIASLERALATRPRSAPSADSKRQALADLHRRIGAWQALVGADPVPALRASVALWREARKTARYPVTCQLAEADVQLRLGEATRVRHDLETALALYEGALAVHPKALSAYAGRARIRRTLGDLDGALADIQRAVGASARSMQFLMERARIRAARGEHAQAREDLERVLERRAGDRDTPAEYRIHRALARTYAAAGDAVAAARHLEKARVLCPAMAD